MLKELNKQCNMVKIQELEEAPVWKIFSRYEKVRATIVRGRGTNTIVF